MHGIWRVCEILIFLYLKYSLFRTDISIQLFYHKDITYYNIINIIHKNATSIKHSSLPHCAGVLFVPMLATISHPLLKKICLFGATWLFTLTNVFMASFLFNFNFNSLFNLQLLNTQLLGWVHLEDALSSKQQSSK